MKKIKIIFAGRFPWKSVDQKYSRKWFLRKKLESAGM